MELDASQQVMKKLKLVGYPYKVFKNTAFLKVGQPTSCSRPFPPVLRPYCSCLAARVGFGWPELALSSIRLLY